MIFELNMEQCIKDSIQYAKEAKRDLKQSYKEGYNAGREKGEKKNALATAKRLKAMNFSDEVIAEGTGLSLNQVKKLK